MSASASDPRLTQFPAALRQLLETELAAGNSITEIASCFPAPPAGAYVKLAKPVTTRPHGTTAEVSFYDRNTSIYSGEWTDARRFYFVLEPPRPPEPEPDMDAIRAARNVPRQQKNRVAKNVMRPNAGTPVDLPVRANSPAAPKIAPTSVVERFRDSMAIDYEKWHDGIGYDLELLKLATPAELKEIEKMVVARGAADWRDVEVLAALRTPRAKKLLKRAKGNGKAEVRGAIMRHAPELVSEDDKMTFLLEALRTAEFYAGLSQALDQVAEYHPPVIVDELFHGALERKSDVAIHFAAMLMFVHGKAKEPFDWAQRPFFLRFDTTSRAEREAVFRELCGKVGVDAARYLRSSA